MWVGWVLCAVTAYFLVRRMVAVLLQHRLALAREATMRTLTAALPFIVVAAALVGGAIGLLAPCAFGDFTVIGFPVALAGMLATTAAGAALVRYRTCPADGVPGKVT
jgi:ABC-type xylose transport system permease subunit